MAIRVTDWKFCPTNKCTGMRGLGWCTLCATVIGYQLNNQDVVKREMEGK